MGWAGLAAAGAIDAAVGCAGAAAPDQLAPQRLERPCLRPIAAVVVDQGDL